MKYNVYSLKDELSGYGMPTLHDNDGMARRALKLAFDADNSILAANPADYTLYKIGVFDTDSGYIESCDVHRVCSCSDFRKEM